MDTFYDALRMTIRNTLSPVSEETVNDIIHAIQCAGFDSLSDLQLVQEKDLMCILKPIPRRKLIKEFNRPGMVEDLNNEYERMKNEAISRQIDEFSVEAKSSFESTPNPVILSANVSSTLSVPKCIWNKKKYLKLLQLYARYKTEFLRPDVDEQTVWKKIASEVRKLYTTLNCDESECHRVIEELKCEYEKIKNEDAKDQHTAKFLDEARKAFETTENPVKMESITELLKTNICRILDSVSEETVNNIIHALNYAGLQFLLDLQFVREDDLPQVLPHFQRRKLIKAWSQHGILLLFSNPSTVVHEQITVGHNTYEDSSAMSSLSPTNANSSISYLSMLAQRQASVGSSYMDTSQAPSNHFSPCTDQTYGASLPEPSPGISSINDHCPLAPGALTGLAPIGGEIIPPVNLYKQMFKTSKWSRRFCVLLLKVYAKYKTELSCSSVEGKQILWRKIAEEVHQQSRCSKCFRGGRRCSLFSGSECMDKIEILRLQYRENKFENVFNGAMVKFFKASRNAFESTEDSAFEKSFGVRTFTELPSRAYSPWFKWTWNKRFALLRVYTIYKQELSSSYINEQSVWKKIAFKVGKKCDAKECHNQICDMKCEYERMKHNKPFELGHARSVFLDEAENAFEKIENPVVFSLQSDLEKWTMSKRDRVTLLQAFTKYKAELLLHNFDVKRQVVWEKLAREVSKKCCSYYGKRRCCYEINRLQRLHKIKKKKLKNIGKPYFFDEAGKAFESTECTGQHEEKNSLKDIIVKKEKNSLKDIIVKKEKNSLKDIIVKKEKRGWYEQINI